MPAGICLPPKLVETFKQAIVSGKINPERLAEMTSAERHQLLSELVGEGNAKFVNGQLEAKLLLKNQQLGMVRWAEKVTGVSPAVKRDLITRIQRLDHVLDPTEEKAFMHDLVATRLGTDVTVKEAKQIAVMSRKIQDLEVKRKPDGTFPSESDRLAYGYAKYDLGQYISDLKNGNQPSLLRETAAHPVMAVGKAAGFTKAIRASMDDSAVFRQGWKTLWTHPGIWQKNARASVANLLKVGVKKQDVVREVMADIISRPNYDKYAKMKLALGNVEEQFPTSLPEKVPVLGRAYKASEQAYEAFLYKTRADVADKLLALAEKSDVNIADPKELTSIGKLINALTGRGDIGHGKAASPLVNNLFFSIRFVKSNFDTLTAHQFQKDVTPFVRKQAAENLAKVVLGTAGVLAIANQLKPGSVEFDPRSKDFGKIKVGHTRFDVSAGMGGMITLAAQIIKNQSKSTTTGVISNMGDGYGSKTAVDAVNSYFENKLSPAAAVIKDLVNRKDFAGNKPTIKGEASNLFVPLPIQTAFSAKGDPQAANQLLISIADGLGIATNNNNPKKDLSQDLTKSDRQLLDKIGKDKFQQYNDSYNEKVNQFMSSSFYKGLAPDDKQSALTSAKRKIKDNLYKSYDFKPSKQRSDKAFSQAISNAVK